MRKLATDPFVKRKAQRASHACRRLMPNLVPMKLRPYSCVDNVPFSASREEVLRIHGSPAQGKRPAISRAGPLRGRDGLGLSGGSLEQQSCRSVKKSWMD